MFFSIAEHVVEMQEWNSREALQKYLDANCNEIIFATEEPDNEAVFFSVLIYLNYSLKSENFAFEDTVLGMGGHTEIKGIQPCLLWWPPNRIVIGFDMKVIGVRLDTREVEFCYDFDTPFRSFTLIDSDQMLLVFNEIGVLALDNEGLVLWRYEADLITACILQSGTLRIAFDESPSITVDLTSGEAM